MFNILLKKKKKNWYLMLIGFFNDLQKPFGNLQWSCFILAIRFSIITDRKKALRLSSKIDSRKYLFPKRINENEINLKETNQQQIQSTLLDLQWLKLIPFHLLHEPRDKKSGLHPKVKQIDEHGRNLNLDTSKERN